MFRRVFAYTLAVLALLVAPVAAAKQLGMLDRLGPGVWQLRTRGASGAVEELCIGSGRDFLQLRHRGMACSYVVIDDKPNEVTVQYNCDGRGYGRTRLRLETDRLVQVESQGIAAGRPFSFVAEARRNGGICRG